VHPYDLVFHSMWLKDGCLIFIQLIDGRVIWMLMISWLCIKG